MIQLGDAPLHEEVQALGMTQKYFNFIFEDIAQAIRQNAIPMALIGTYRLHRVKVPLWVVIWLRREPSALIASNKLTMVGE